MLRCAIFSYIWLPFCPTERGGGGSMVLACTAELVLLEGGRCLVIDREGGAGYS